MAINYGVTSESRSREYTTSQLKILNTSVNGEALPFSISYSLDTEISTIANVEVEFSTDSGTNWATATPDPANPNHDSTSSINVSASSVLDLTFIWDAYGDLNPSNDYTFSGDIAVRIRASDAFTNFTGWTEIPSFYFDTTFSANITAIVDRGHYIDVEYEIYGLPDTYAVELDYTTDGTYQTATIYNPSTTHTSNIAASVGSGVYSWYAESNLTPLFDGGYYVRLRASNGVVYSVYDISDPIEKTYLPIVVISDIDNQVGNTTEISYEIISDRSSSSSFDVTVSYSTDGATFYNATAETSNPNHSGVSGLAKGQKVFAWDVDADLQANQLIEDAVIVKISVNDGTSSSTPVQTGAFTVNMTPSVTLDTPVQILENTKIPFSITSLNDGETYTIEMEYSTDGTNYSAAPANNAISGHADSGLSKDTDYIYVWDSLTSLGNEFNGPYSLRARVTNGLPDTGGQAYSQYSAYSSHITCEFPQWICNRFSGYIYLQYNKLCQSNINRLLGILN